MYSLHYCNHPTKRAIIITGNVIIMILFVFMIFPICGMYPIKSSIKKIIEKMNVFIKQNKKINALTFI